MIVAVGSGGENGKPKRHHDARIKGTQSTGKKSFLLSAAQLS